jgi:hypothetical protein
MGESRIHYYTEQKLCEFEIVLIHAPRRFGLVTPMSGERMNK